MSCEQVCVSQVDTIMADESVLTAAVRMRDHLIGCLVVCNDQRQPIGMLTDRDLATRVVADGIDASRTAVGDVMSRSPRTVVAGTSPEKIVVAMQRVPCRRMPVVDDQGKLVALATMDDVLGSLAEQLGQVGSLVRQESPASLDAV